MKKTVQLFEIKEQRYNWVYKEKLKSMKSYPSFLTLDPYSHLLRLDLDYGSG